MERWENNEEASWEWGVPGNSCIQLGVTNSPSELKGPIPDLPSARSETERSASPRKNRSSLFSPYIAGSMLNVSATTTVSRIAVYMPP